MSGKLLPDQAVEETEVADTPAPPAPVRRGRYSGVEIRLAHGRVIGVSEDFDEAVLITVKGQVLSAAEHFYSLAA